MNVRRVGAVAAGITTLCATFALGSWFGAARVRDRDEWADGRLLSTAIDSVRANALDSLPSEELIRRAMSGMLRELHDPYAALLRPDGYKRYKGSLHGEGDGVGLSMRTVAGVVTVSRVAAGSPAMTAGVQTGDRVLSVNGVPIAEGWGRRAPDTSSAPIDSALVLVVRLPGDTVALRMHRGQWHVSAVADAAMLTDSVGYVRLSSITSRSTEELEHAVSALQQQGARALMLDLRGNGGGLFEEGVDAAGLFLPRGAVVSSLAGRNGARPEVHRGKRSRWPTLRLTILVDGGTASAAEVIAAALREHDRALLVGTPTYGKGVVQRVVRLTPDLALRLTTARWLTPKGHALERRQGSGPAAHGGLQPDVLLDDATRFDAFMLPKEWPLASNGALLAMADTLARLALQDDWPTSPVAAFETRLQARAMGMRTSPSVKLMSRAERVSIVTRLATARLLELSPEPSVLLRYDARSDAAIRAGLDLLTPGVDVVPVDATVSGRTPAQWHAKRDSGAVSLLDSWLVSRHREVQLLPFHSAPHSTATLSADASAPDSAMLIDRETPALWVESVRSGAQLDTLFTVRFVAQPGISPIATGDIVRVSGPNGAASAYTARIVARRAFRVANAPGRIAEAQWRYGWSYAAVVSRGARAAPLTGFRGWLVVPSSDSTRVMSNRAVAERSSR